MSINLIMTITIKQLTENLLIIAREKITHQCTVMNFSLDFQNEDC